MGVCKNQCPHGESNQRRSVPQSHVLSIEPSDSLTIERKMHLYTPPRAHVWRGGMHTPPPDGFATLKSEVWGCKKLRNIRVPPVIAPKKGKFFEFALDRIEVLKPISTG
jgi:hypothetical protein